MFFFNVEGCGVLKIYFVFQIKKKVVLVQFEYFLSFYYNNLLWKFRVYFKIFSFEFYFEDKEMEFNVFLKVNF